jgi:hypothetical protein
VCLEEVSAGELAVLVPQGHQAAELDGDVVGLALVCILYLCREAWTARTRTARDHSSAQRLMLGACLTCLLSVSSALFVHDVQTRARDGRDGRDGEARQPVRRSLMVTAPGRSPHGFPHGNLE